MRSHTANPEERRGEGPEEVCRGWWCSPAQALEMDANEPIYDVMSSAEGTQPHADRGKRPLIRAARSVVVRESRAERRRRGCQAGNPCCDAQQPCRRKQARRPPPATPTAKKQDVCMRAHEASNESGASDENCAPPHSNRAWEPLPPLNWSWGTAHEDQGCERRPRRLRSQWNSRADIVPPTESTQAERGGVHMPLRGADRIHAPRKNALDATCRIGSGAVNGEVTGEWNEKGQGGGKRGEMGLDVEVTVKHYSASQGELAIKVLESSKRAKFVPKA
ncbi:hypothetical protein R3P38DRAFT_2806160 [Favolaschia claudopus]|uniref:Uncharacterized protein n=1 Tax=Favolaschia claudopus TaxID=2862362 RepID=A0AAV9ZKT2_9AGAR